MSIDTLAAEAVREAITVPAHIAAAANACAYDLLHGPSYSLVPAAGIEAFNVDSFATFPDDLDDTAGTITETYTGPVGEALREFIGELPATVYVDADGFYMGENEPAGEWLGPDLEPCDPYDDGAEYYKPEPYYAVGSSEIVAALFGAVIAREFR